MNRVKKEELKRKAEARKGLSKEEIRQLEEKEAREEKFRKLVHEIHIKIFPEEYDFMYDSYSDSNQRSRGENPMSEDYTKKVNERRKSLGVPPLAKNGMPPKGNNSYEIARKLVEKGKNNMQ